MAIPDFIKYRDEQLPGVFIGCPLDADPYAAELKSELSKIPHPGGRQTVHYWRRNYETRISSAQRPEQYQIPRTSSALVGPIFIVFFGTIGTPVPRPPEGWEPWRKWLDEHGFDWIALLGEPAFRSVDQVPSDKVPLTGTLFELFDALQRTDSVELHIIHIRSSNATNYDAFGDLQQSWLKRLLAALRQHRTVIEIDNPDQLGVTLRPLLRQSFGFGILDPFLAPLPGLQAVAQQHLLFGRRDLITCLGDRLTQAKEPATFVLGVSGSGKSSVLSAGLEACLFPANRPPVLAGLVAVRCEPLALAGFSIWDAPIDSATRSDLLQLDAADPLIGLARVLRGDPSIPATMCPLPVPMPDVPDPPALTGDTHADLHAAIVWWLTVMTNRDGTLVIVLDQAERIDAIAQRVSRLKQETRGSTCPAELAPGWWRLTALLSLLAGIVDLSIFKDKTISAAKSIQRLDNVRCVFGLHRRQALALWPILDSNCPAPIDVPPITDRSTLEAIVTGTLGAYGLEIQKPLLETIIDEAATLATSYLRVRLPSPDTVRVLDETKQASILPQLATALGNLIEHWRILQRQGGSGEPYSRSLDLENYENVASVANSINTLGERAWNAWAGRLEPHLQLDRSRYFHAERLIDHQRDEFKHLLRTLVDAGETDQRDLAYLSRTGAASKKHELLIEALQAHRLLVTTGARYWRLPHRTILDYWFRASDELESLKPLLNSKARARLIREAEGLTGTTEWSEALLNEFSLLLLQWVGADEGDDARLRQWLGERLVSQMVPSEVSLSNEAAIHRLPGQALLGDHEPLATELLTHCINTGAPETVLAELIVIAAQLGRPDLVRALLGDDPVLSRQRANARDPVEGQVAVNMAAAFGHVETVKLLLEVGASPAEPETQYPVGALILATEFGHETIVNLLLDAGAPPDGSPEGAEMTPLLIASTDGHAGIVQSLLHKGATIDCRHTLTADTPLMVAARAGHSDVVRLLLNAGSQSVRSTNAEGHSPLVSAAFSGDEKSIKTLIEYEAPLEQMLEPGGDTALSVAAGLGHTEVLKTLIDAGALCDEPNPVTHATPLILACERGHLDIVQCLINNQASVNYQDKHGGATPLLLAATFGYPEIVRCLVNAGANPDPPSSDSGNFPLIMAAQEGHLEVVRFLMDEGATPNRRCTHSGDDALHRAAQNGFIDVVTLLLDCCSDPVHYYSTTFEKALLAAANMGRTPVVQALLAFQPDVDAVDPETGTTALCFAAQDGYSEITSLLINVGANVNYPGAQAGTDALYLAAASNHVDIVNQLLNAGADPNRVDPEDDSFPLLGAASHGVSSAIVAQLILKGADVNRVQRTTGTSPLLIAAQEGYTDLVETLLAHGADPDLADPIDGGFPLVLAAQCGHFAVVDLLISKNAKINRSDMVEGDSAVSVSVTHGHVDVLKRLLESGADPDLRNPVTGTTPLGIAINQADLQSVGALLDAGASAHAPVDENGTTPLILAVELEHPAIVHSVIDAGGEVEALPTQLKRTCQALLSDPDKYASKRDETHNTSGFPEEIKKESFPGQWVKLSSEQIRREYVDMSTRELFSVAGDSHMIHSTLSTTFPPGLSIRRLQARSGSLLEQTSDQLWLRPGGRNRPVVIGSGFPLDALLKDYSAQGLTLCIRTDDELIAFAVLVLACSEPARQPLRPDVRLPLAINAKTPVFAYIDDSWRTWQVIPDVNGRYVQLPWIYQRSLVLGRVRVTETGIGSKIIDESIRLCDDQDWVWDRQEQQHTAPEQKNQGQWSEVVGSSND